MCSTPQEYFSTLQIAQVLGVSKSSVKRWIDTEKLRAEKTPGGHRRVSASELFRFAAAHQLMLTSSDALDPKQLERTSTALPDVKRNFLKALKTGNGFALVAIGRQLRLQGHSLAALTDAFVWPAFTAIRNACQHPSEECMVLHRAIDILRDVMPQWEAHSGKVPRGRKILFADIGYEVDGLPTYLAQLSVHDMAQSLQLGVNVPLPVITGAMSHFKPHIFWLSASGPIIRETLADDWKAIHAQAKESQTKLCVFGNVARQVPGPSCQEIDSFEQFRNFVTASP